MTEADRSAGVLAVVFQRNSQSAGLGADSRNRWDSREAIAVPFASPPLCGVRRASYVSRPHLPT